jgi:hypothetical protein
VLSGLSKLHKSGFECVKSGWSNISFSESKNIFLIGHKGQENHPDNIFETNSEFSLPLTTVIQK